MPRFSVPEMSCGHCTATIEKAVKSADPAALVNCDLQTRTVAVISAATVETLAAAMRQAGYEAEPRA